MPPAGGSDRLGQLSSRLDLMARGHADSVRWRRLCAHFARVGENARCQPITPVAMAWFQAASEIGQPIRLDPPFM